MIMWGRFHSPFRFSATRSIAFVLSLAFVLSCGPARGTAGTLEAAPPLLGAFDLPVQLEFPAEKQLQGKLLFCGSLPGAAGSRLTKEVDDDLPGVPLPPSPVTGTLWYENDGSDCYNVYLEAGQNLYVSITNGAGDVRALLASPEATDVDSAWENGWWVASTAVTGHLCGFWYQVPISATCACWAAVFPPPTPSST